MELKPGLSALVTGGAGGIGREIVLALARKGIFVTVADMSEENGREVASLAGKEISKFHVLGLMEFPPVQFVKCDVTDSKNLAAAFEVHVETYGGLDICITCAGIMNPIPFHKDESDGSNSWRRTLNIDLLAVVDSTRLAIRAMKKAKRPGAIIHLASSSGLFPLFSDPIYSGSKAGVVLFTRSLATYKRQGIRVNVLCPEFVQTEFSYKIDPALIERVGGLLPVEMVVKGAFELISDESKAGSCLWISKRRGLEYTPTFAEEEKYRGRSQNSRKKSSEVVLSHIQIPESFEKIVVHTLSHDFRRATKIVQAPLRLPLKPNQVLLKIMYAGVNASDVNFGSGRYHRGRNVDLVSRLPFAAGFEAVGIIAGVGDSVKHLKVGIPAAIMTYGGYAEFAMVDTKHILPVARADPEVVAMLRCGLTASIALEKAGQRGSGKSVLVTAADGGTGQFAIQLAKLAGNKVIATCGDKDKAELLKNLGVDRVIDYNAEKIDIVLNKEFPKGVDVIYESVGGEMFVSCLNALATYGHLIVVDMLSQYQGEHRWKPRHDAGLCEKVIAKSQTVGGLFLSQYAHLWQQHLDKLMDLYLSGKLKVALDPKLFLGIGSVADAVDYLHSGRSDGKVVVCIDPRSFKHPHAKL